MTAPLDLDAPPPCPECGGTLTEAHQPSAGRAPEVWAYTCQDRICRWDVERDERLTLRTAPWTAALAAEVERLRAGGCARGQHPAGTQFCAEAVRFARERDEARAARDALCLDVIRGTEYARGVAEERARVRALATSRKREAEEAIGAPGGTHRDDSRGLHRAMAFGEVVGWCGDHADGGSHADR